MRRPYLVPGGLVRGHVALQLGAVRERVVAQRAGEVLLVLLMAVLDVLLQRSQTLVASVAVGAGQQLGESIWRSRWQVCKERGRGAQRSANQWRLMGGMPRVVWELSAQSAAVLASHPRVQPRRPNLLTHASF